MRVDGWKELVKKEIVSGFALSQLPLGENEEGRVVFSHRKNRPDRYCHTCVTGALRTTFLVNTVASLAALYGEKASFLVLSQKKEYLKLLTIKGADITVPYLQSERQFASMKQLALAQANTQKKNLGYHRFFLIVDGWESLPFASFDNTLSSFRQFISDVSGGAEVLSGVDFSGTIFAGFEGAFVGVHNSLVSVDEKGKADVTYVGEDCVLDYPQSIRYAEFFDGGDYGQRK